MWPWLKVIASCIRQYTRIQHVNFTNAPAIESFLWKQRIENRLVADLNVAGTNANPADTQLFWYHSHI